MDRRTAAHPLPGQLSLFDVDARSMQLGGRVVEYRFLRRRRRTLGITIDANGMRVAAPLRAPVRDIEAFIRDKERWILSKLEEWRQVPRAEVLRGATGETLPLFGSPVVLEVSQGRRTVHRESGSLMVRAPRAAGVLETLLAWLKSTALEALAPRTAHFAARLGVTAPSVSLSGARGLWGSCTEGGRVRLNWRLVHLEPGLADYVVAHEVAHLVEMNHSSRFWDLVGCLYPSWREARERLELAGAALPIIGGTR
jgi:predicted metal-dependent hydrolase